MTGPNYTRPESTPENPLAPSVRLVGKEVGRAEDPLLGIVPHILIVDDDKDNCGLLARLYRQSGYPVEVAFSAEDALARLATADIDLVVTNIQLSGLSGVELVKHVQREFPDVPVTAMTGQEDIRTAVEILKLGASDCLMKHCHASIWS